MKEQNQPEQFQKHPSFFPNPQLFSAPIKTNESILMKQS